MYLMKLYPPREQQSGSKELYRNVNSNHAGRYNILIQERGRKKYHVRLLRFRDAELAGSLAVLFKLRKDDITLYEKDARQSFLDCKQIVKSIHDKLLHVDVQLILLVAYILKRNGIYAREIVESVLRLAY